MRNLDLALREGSLALALVLFGVGALGCGGSDEVIVRDAEGNEGDGGESPGEGEGEAPGEGGAGGEASPDPGEDLNVQAPAPPVKAYVAGGMFKPLGAYQGIYGRAQIVRMANGETRVEVHVEGLGAGKTYPAHLHVLPCAFQGGGHYQIDPTVEQSGQANELWPAVTANEKGVGRARATAAHHVRPEGQAVVIHDPDANNGKMACADLIPEPEGAGSRAGSFHPFASAQTLDAEIGGGARMSLSEAGTDLVLNITGLNKGAEYASHVHTLPCALGGGGPHYKIDPSIEASEAANELWPYIAVDDEGKSNPRSVNPHAVRPEAQSVVIHRVVADGKPKVACADLVRGNFVDHVIHGTQTLLQAGTDKGYGAATASATLTRSIGGTTKVELSVTGLPAVHTYPAHLHHYTCGLESGGGHYVMDPNAEAGEDNEVWLPLDVGADGAGTKTRTVDHIARPEALSIVVHDWEDGARILCIDLM